MPVTFTVANHPANPVRAPYLPLQSAEGLLDSTWGERNRHEVRSKQVLQSTFSDSPVDLTKVRPKKNGFMNTVVEAYNQHHRLVLRPDDVWIAILGQFNFYVNAHAEELRSYFVAHEGQKELYVEGHDFGHLARRMTELIDDNVVDKELREWILPDFTTTRHNDVVVASVLMMATLKAYFSYGMGICCGLPSVTLEGERSDWVNILNRVEKLEMFGDEPTAWAKLLRPILSRFVSSFDGSPDLDFWSKICHYYSGGSGPDEMCGWITAFAVWNTKGKWQGPNPEYHREGMDEYSGMYSLTLDDAQYGIMDPASIPSGYCEVDVKFNDDGTKYDCMMVSGHMGQLVEGENDDTVRPLPAWFMFVKEEVPASEKPKWY